MIGQAPVRPPNPLPHCSPGPGAHPGPPDPRVSAADSPPERPREAEDVYPQPHSPGHSQGNARWHSPGTLPPLSPGQLAGQSGHSPPDRRMTVGRQAGDPETGQSQRGAQWRGGQWLACAACYQAPPSCPHLLPLAAQRRWAHGWREGTVSLLAWASAHRGPPLPLTQRGSPRNTDPREGTGVATTQCPIRSLLGRRQEQVASVQVALQNSPEPWQAGYLEADPGGP